MKKVLGYARVSSQKQKLEVQQDLIKEYCEKHEYHLVDTLSEKMSGRKGSRPEWDRVLNAVRNKKIDGVVVIRADRVARSTKNLLALLEVFYENEVEFISIKEPQFSTGKSAQGKFLITVLAAAAEFEADLSRDRLQEGKERMLIVGTRSGKPPHRPEIPIDWDDYDKDMRLGVTKKAYAKNIGVSDSKLYAALRKREEMAEMTPIV